jgi:iron complex outermembrane receptor protein
MESRPKSHLRTYPLRNLVAALCNPRRGVQALAVLASCGIAHGALAQQATTAASATASNEGLEEVVVTAERRSEDPQTTAIALTALSGTDLAQTHQEGIADLQTSTPALSVNTAGQYYSINIRGIGNAAVNPAITPGIAVIRDGLFQAETIMLSEPFYDIRDVEVLRGPQGTFVGQSSTGGAVLINSADPNFTGVNGFVEGLLGNYSDTKLTGAVNLPVSDTFAARIAFNVEHRGSFYKDLGTDKTFIQGAPLTDPGHLDDRNMRVSLLWKPTEDFQALLKVENNHHDTGGTVGQPNQNTFISYNDPTTGAPLATPAVVHSPYYAYSTHIPFVLNFDQTDVNSTEVNEHYGLELKYTLPDGIILRSQSGFQHDDIREINDGDGSSVSALYDYHVIGPDNNYYSQEFNLISPSTGKLTWIAGGSWFYRNTPVNDNAYLSNGTGSGPFPAPAASYLQQQLTINAAQRTMGVFGQASYQLLDPLKLVVGARENWDANFNGGEIQIYPGAGTTAVPYGTPGIFVPLTGWWKDSVPTWKVDLDYTPLPGQFFYGFVTRGYKSGGVNAGSPVGFNPEHVTNYELGWKNTMLDGHFKTDLDLYYINLDDLQQPITLQATGGGGVTNVGASTIKGFEAEMEAHLAGFNAMVSLDYNDTALGPVSLIATYRLPGGSGNNLPQCPAANIVGTSCNLAGYFNYNPYIVNLSGGANPFSPKVTVDVVVDYGLRLTDSLTLRPRVTYNHVDKQYASVFQNDNYFLMNARNLYGANLNLEAGSWNLQGYVTNLTNETYVSAYNGNFEYYGNPRQFGVMVDRKF